MRKKICYFPFFDENENNVIKSFFVKIDVIEFSKILLFYCQFIFIVD